MPAVDISFVMISKFSFAISLTLRRGNVIPGIGLYVILGNAATFGIHVTQIELRLGIPLFGGYAKPWRCFGIVLGDAATSAIHVTQLGICASANPCLAAI